jgi:amino-acid N-acetyltransferase
MPYQIRPASTADLPSIQTLLSRNGLPDVGLSDHIHNALVALSQDEIVGVAAVELYPDGALLRSVAVAAEHRGNKLGLQLAARAMHLASLAGAPGIFLLTETASNFFPRLGFVQTIREEVPAGVRSSPEFNGVCPVSAVVMKRPLD